MSQCEESRPPCTFIFIEMDFALNPWLNTCFFTIVCLNFHSCCHKLPCEQMSRWLPCEQNAELDEQPSTADPEITTSTRSAPNPPPNPPPDHVLKKVEEEKSRLLIQHELDQLEKVELDEVEVVSEVDKTGEVEVISAEPSLPPAKKLRKQLYLFQNAKILANAPKMLSPAEFMAQRNANKRTPLDQGNDYDDVRRHSKKSRHDPEAMDTLEKATTTGVYKGPLLMPTSKAEASSSSSSRPSSLGFEVTNNGS